MNDASCGSEPVRHRLLLIRHGETIDNVAGVYGGSRDAALTNHGVHQTQRLGAFLAAEELRFTHIFSSDLSRAFRTATAIRNEQLRTSDNEANVPEVVQQPEIREQDYGSYEGVPFGTRRQDLARQSKSNVGQNYGSTKDQNAEHVDIEDIAAVEVRATRFVKRDLHPLLHDPETPHVIAVVSHGVLLSTLWRCIMRANPGLDVRAESELFADRYIRSLDRIGPFSNTGYLDLQVYWREWRQGKTVPSESPSDTISKGDAQARENSNDTHQLVVQILAINNTKHLQGLKRTKGGVGSEKHDERQKSLDSFFKKRPSG